MAEALDYLDDLHMSQSRLGHVDLVDQECVTIRENVSMLQFLVLFASHGNPPSDEVRFVENTLTQI
jgi:hypothetical protein